MKTLLLTLILSTTSTMATDLVGITELTVIETKDVSSCSTAALIKADISGNYKRIESRINAIHGIVSPLAQELDLDACIILSMIAQESSFKASAKSKVGAKGLMQVMTSTKVSVLKSLGKDKVNAFYTANLNSNLSYKEIENILVGSTYFKSLVKKFNSQDTAVIAYNEGPTKIQRMINKGISFGKKHNHLIKVKENLALLALN